MLDECDDSVDSGGWYAWRMKRPFSSSRGGSSTRARSSSDASEARDGSVSSVSKGPRAEGTALSSVAGPPPLRCASLMACAMSSPFRSVLTMARISRAPPPPFLMPMRCRPLCTSSHSLRRARTFSISSRSRTKNSTASKRPSMSRASVSGEARKEDSNRPPAAVTVWSMLCSREPTREARLRECVSSSERRVAASMDIDDCADREAAANSCGTEERCVYTR